MKVLGVIPARYQSSRYPGKPLEDILGKPMIWWVYQQAIKAKKMNEVYVATDDERIFNVCQQYGIRVIMTSQRHKTSTDRVAEVARKLEADLYVEIMGDEPLISPDVIDAVVPEVLEEGFFVSNLIAVIESPTEVVDFTNLKCTVDMNGNAIAISRSPIPYPKGTLDFEYKKLLGVCAFTGEALEFYSSNERGPLEQAEDNDFYRFLERGKKVRLVEVVCEMLSVDTPKDLERVRKVLAERIEHENKSV